MKLARNPDRLSFEQAAHWHLLMQKSPGSRERAAFDDWLMESRRHVRNYLLIAALDRELLRIDPGRRLEVDGLQSGSSGSAIVSLQPRLESALPSPPQWRTRPGSRWVAGIAAALVLLALAALLRPWDLAGRYTTAVGEQRIVKLSDGSVMYLNTESRARVDYSEKTRDIRLLRGEALFVVARDPDRPFRVATGTAVIQAVGTEFNVYRHDKETAVAVLEGRVQVFANDGGSAALSSRESEKHERVALPLSAGEEANVENDGRIIKRKAPDLSNAVAWRERRLVFRENPLNDIVFEFNRYNSAPRFRVDGTTAGARRYSGIFDAYDPESLAQVLSADGALILDRAGPEIIIRERPLQ